MRVSDLAPEELRSRLRREGVPIRMGPYVTRVRSTLPDLAPAVGHGYAFSEIGDTGFADFDVSIVRPRGLRRWVRPQALFLLDGLLLFEPYPARLTMPLLEWGLNWCLAGSLHDHLIVHAAVLERNGRAILMPAKPGTGKSTLCTALVHRGWRLLSDEMALLRPSDGLLDPIPRPVALKEGSIEVIRRFAPEAAIGALWPDTIKGTVAYVRPPEESMRRAREPAVPGWIVFPTWTRGAKARFAPHGKADAFLRVADNCFNYGMLGVRGFETLGALVERCQCLEFDYGDLAEAVPEFERLAGGLAAKA
ncbi:MAG: HprK-related kinase A [Planctomycetota bacterium]